LVILYKKTYQLSLTQHPNFIVKAFAFRVIRTINACNPLEIMPFSSFLKIFGFFENSC